jgi:hypothetical protein
MAESKSTYLVESSTASTQKVHGNSTIQSIINSSEISEKITGDCIKLFETLCNALDIPEEWYDAPKWREFGMYYRLTASLKFHKYNKILDNIITILLDNYPFNNIVDDGKYDNVVNMFFFLNGNRQAYDIHKCFYYRFLTIKDAGKKLNVVSKIMGSAEFIELPFSERVHISNEFLQIIDDNINTFPDECIASIFCKSISELEKEVNQTDYEKLIGASKGKNIFVNGLTKQINSIGDALCNSSERLERADMILSNLISPELLKEKIIVAGGCVQLMVDKLCNPIDDDFKNTDIDIFIYGSSTTERKETCNNIMKYFYNNYKGIYCIVRRSVVCIYFPDVMRCIQVICGKFTSPLDILLSFDFSNIKWFYDSKGIHGLYCSLETLITRLAVKRHNHLADLKRLYKVYIRQYNIQEFQYNQLKTNIPLNMLFENYIPDELANKEFNINRENFSTVFDQIEGGISYSVKLLVNSNENEHLIGNAKTSKLRYIFVCLCKDYKGSMNRLNKDRDDNGDFASMTLVIANKRIILKNSQHSQDTENKWQKKEKKNKRHFKCAYNGSTYGRISGLKPQQAANKAFTMLIKQIGKPDQKQFNFSIIECTRGSNGRKYVYAGKRELLPEPVIIPIKVKGEPTMGVTYTHKNIVKRICDPDKEIPDNNKCNALDDIGSYGIEPDNDNKNGALDCDKDGAVHCDKDGAVHCDKDGALDCDKDGALDCDKDGVSGDDENNGENNDENNGENKGDISDGADSDDDISDDDNKVDNGDDNLDRDNLDSDHLDSDHLDKSESRDVPDDIPDAALLQSSCNQSTIGSIAPTVENKKSEGAPRDMDGISKDLDKYLNELTGYLINGLDNHDKMLMNMEFIMKTVKYKKLKYHRYYPSSRASISENLYMLSLFEYISESTIKRELNDTLHTVQYDGDFRENFETCYWTNKDKEMLKENKIVLLNRELLANEDTLMGIRLVKSKRNLKKYELPFTLRINLPIMKCYDINADYNKGIRLFLISNEFKEVDMLVQLEGKINDIMRKQEVNIDNCYFNSIIKKSRYQDWWRKAPEIIDQIINQQKIKLENEYDKDKVYYNAKVFYERNKKHFEDIGNPLWKNKPTERDFLKTIRVVVGRKTKVLLGNKPSTVAILKTLDLTRAEFQVTLDLKYITIHQQKHTKMMVIRPFYDTKYVTLVIKDYLHIN